MTKRRAIDVVGTLNCEGPLARAPEFGTPLDCSACDAVSRAELSRLADEWQAKFNAAGARALRAEAEVERLREALGTVASIWELVPDATITERASAAYDMRCVARKALAGGEG